jgi:hypothetical protein
LVGGAPLQLVNGGKWRLREGALASNPRHFIIELHVPKM